MEQLKFKYEVSVFTNLQNAWKHISPEEVLRFATSRF